MTRRHAIKTAIIATASIGVADASSPYPRFTHITVPSPDGCTRFLPIRRTNIPDVEQYLDEARAFADSHGLFLTSEVWPTKAGPCSDPEAPIVKLLLGQIPPESPIPNVMIYASCDREEWQVIRPSSAS